MDPGRVSALVPDGSRADEASRTMKKGPMGRRAEALKQREGELMSFRRED